MPDQFIPFAGYNRLMNRRCTHAAGQLGAKQLRQDRGVFFKSAPARLERILGGGIIWLKRFNANSPKSAPLAHIECLFTPGSLDRIAFDDLVTRRRQRQRIDDIAAERISGPGENDIGQTPVHRNTAGVTHKKPRQSLPGYLSPHQVHQRGQATALLTQSGIGFGDIGLLESVDEQT